MRWISSARMLGAVMADGEGPVEVVDLVGFGLAFGEPGCRVGDRPGAPEQVGRILGDVVVGVELGQARSRDALIGTEDGAHDDALPRLVSGLVAREIRGQSCVNLRLVVVPRERLLHV